MDDSLYIVVPAYNEEELKISQKKEFMFKTFTFLSLAALAFLFSLQCSSHIWKNNAASTDSAVFQYIARMILDGKMPYRDGDHIYSEHTYGAKRKAAA